MRIVKGECSIENGVLRKLAESLVLRTEVESWALRTEKPACFASTLETKICTHSPVEVRREDREFTEREVGRALSFNIHGNLARDYDNTSMREVAESHGEALTDFVNAFFDLERYLWREEVDPAGSSTSKCSMSTTSICTGTTGAAASVRSHCLR